MVGEIIIVRKKYDDPYAVGDVINYVMDSLYFTDAIANETELDSIKSAIDDFHRVQSAVNMEGHKRLFHMIITVPFGAYCERRLERLMNYAISYFNQKGYQAIAAFHEGSKGNYKNLHFHLVVNPISYIDGSRLYDTNTTYCEFQGYLQERSNIYFKLISKNTSDII